MYARLDEAKKAVISVGEEIKRVGLPRGLTPMVFAFTGSTGNVARVRMPARLFKYRLY